MSLSAVCSTHSGMACSEHGATKRLSTMTSLSRRARAERPISLRISPKTQPLPELMANVHRPSLSCFLQAHLVGVHRHDIIMPFRGHPGRADPAYDVVDQRIGTVQGHLPLQRSLDPVHQAQPLLLEVPVTGRPTSRSSSVADPRGVLTVSTNR